MTSSLITPTIEQSLVQSWENNFIALTQQKESLLGGLKAIKNISFSSNKHNVGRMGSTKLEEITGRNPDAQWDEALMDNRQMTKRNFGKSFIIDKKDVREAMADPTSAIYMQINAALQREKDKFIANAALAAVNVGDPNAGTALTSVSAATDGVLTTVATGGLTYALLQQLMGNAINNSVAYGTMQNSGLSLIVSGSDFMQLVNEDKFINNNYTSLRPVDNGYITKLFGMDVVVVPGNDTGVITNVDPILAESGTTRSCLLLSPEAIMFSLDNIKFTWVDELEGKYRSSGLKFYCEMSAMRTEGVRTQVITTTF